MLITRTMARKKTYQPSGPSQRPVSHTVDNATTRFLELRFQEGKKAESDSDFQLAERIYREILATFERNRWNAATPLAALGYALLNQRKLEEAEGVFKRSVRLNASLFEGHANLAVIYRAKDRWKECIAASKRALEIDPKHVATLLNIAEAQKETRQYGLSVQNFLLALSLDNDSVEARKGLASNYVNLGDPSVSIPLFRKVFEMDPECWNSRSYMLFGMQYDPTVSKESVLAEHLHYGSIIREKAGVAFQGFQNTPDPNRKIRIGYMSSDFRHHVVMRFVEKIFTAHDRSAFEVVLIHTSPKSDVETERIKKRGDEWIDIGSMGDFEAADLLRSRKLDIVVDLAGHSGTTKLSLIALRVAPIQVLWLGYSGTSGVDSMDYVLLDNIVAPPGERAYFSEQVLRLPGAYLCFSSNSERPVSSLPYDRNGYITFGSLNNPSKINEYVVRWWSEILKSVPTSKLLLRYALFVDPLVRERIAKMFRKYEIPKDRYQMLEGTKDFVAGYDDIDIALDTFPYTGTTTTCEALWMGVPVVVLRGDRFVSRVGASILTFGGLKDLVTESPQEYIRVAVDLAKDPDNIRQLRQDLRTHLASTPVFECASFTRGLEATYRQIFTIWCDRQQATNPLLNLAACTQNVALGDELGIAR